MHCVCTSFCFLKIYFIEKNHCNGNVCIHFYLLDIILFFNFVSLEFSDILACFVTFECALLYIFMFISHCTCMCV